MLEIDNHLIHQTKSVNWKYNEKEDVYNGLDVNIAIASIAFLTFF